MRMQSRSMSDVRSAWVSISWLGAAFPFTTRGRILVSHVLKVQSPPNDTARFSHMATAKLLILHAGRISNLTPNCVLISTPTLRIIPA